MILARCDRRVALTILLALASAPALHAQAGAIFPEQPLDSNRAAVQRALHVLRDTLHPVVAAIGQLERDFRITSPQLMSVRARGLAAACSAAKRNVAPARAVVETTKVGGSERRKAKHLSMLAALDTLGLNMTRCAGEFEQLGQPGNGEEARSYGNRRAQPIRQGIHAYERVLDGFFRMLDIPNRPLGAGPVPLAN